MIKCKTNFLSVDIDDLRCKATMSTAHSDTPVRVPYVFACRVVKLIREMHLPKEEDPCDYS